MCKSWSWLGVSSSSSILQWPLTRPSPTLIKERYLITDIIPHDPLPPVPHSPLTIILMHTHIIIFVILSRTPLHSDCPCFFIFSSGNFFTLSIGALFCGSYLISSPYMYFIIQDSLLSKSRCRRKGVLP